MKSFWILIGMGSAFAWSSESATAGPLTVKSNGADYIAASRDERDMWGYGASRALHHGEGGREIFAFGRALVQCLDGALTKTNAVEAKSMNMLTGTGLPELTAFCATMLQNEENAK
ncbi:hypothetical protein [Hyphomicrobium sp. 99]|uniref:hypothetical protein n=1 Tax=Hyphomicrobium sp. 99 TaxID=1163419 RepID=UPI0005F8159A|nr:hypothetical protein [Hyphomicrobium sp. 99]